MAEHVRADRSRPAARVRCGARCASTTPTQEAGALSPRARRCRRPPRGTRRRHGRRAPSPPRPRRRAGVASPATAQPPPRGEVARSWRRIVISATMCRRVPSSRHVGAPGRAPVAVSPRRLTRTRSRRVRATFAATPPRARLVLRREPLDLGAQLGLAREARLRSRREGALRAAPRLASNAITAARHSRARAAHRVSTGRGRKQLLKPTCRRAPAPPSSHPVGVARPRTNREWGWSASVPPFRSPAHYPRRCSRLVPSGKTASSRGTSFRSRRTSVRCAGGGRCGREA